MKYLLILLSLFGTTVFAQDTITIHHQRYTTTFDTVLLYPVKVHWIVTSNDVCEKGSRYKVKRTNDFKPDPQLKKYTNLKADYKLGSKQYDRGHNMDAADNSCNIDQMHECFYFSNMTPQTKHLNEQTWEKLEEHTRDLTKQYGKIEVWCGSYGSKEKIGRVTVPKYCWKIIRYKGNVEAYVMPNTSDVNVYTYNHYLSTLTGIRELSHLSLREIKANTKL
jgi:DNA/RNA endonuclease G (NUC1)